MIMDNFFYNEIYIPTPFWRAACDGKWRGMVLTDTHPQQSPQDHPRFTHKLSPTTRKFLKRTLWWFLWVWEVTDFSDFCSYSDFQLSSLFIHRKLQMGAGMLFVHLGESRSWSRLWVWAAILLSSELQTFSSAAKWVQLGRCNWRRSVGVRHWLQLLRTLRVLTRAHHHPASQHPSSYPSSTHTHTHISIYPPHAHTNIYI